jgi:hypothetical protein
MIGIGLGITIMFGITNIPIVPTLS